MKKGLIYLFVFLMSTLAFVGCSKDDDKPEVPPTVTEVAKTYTGDKLKITVNGENAASNASVDIVTKSDNTVSYKLTNIVPGVKSFEIPNITFEAKTKSAYYSALGGSVTDNLLGYAVEADGRVDEDILTIDVKLSEVKGETAVNAKKFRSLTLKGDMDIDVMGMATTSSQRVYTSAPKGNDTSKIKLEIKNFQFQGMGIGDIVLDTIQVEKRGDVYGLKALNRKLTLVIGEVGIDVRGAFLVDGEDISLQLYLMIDASPLTVYVDFNGDVIKESTDLQAKITVEGDAVVDPVVASGNNYTFQVWQSTSASKLLFTPKIEIAEKATLDSVVLYNDNNKKVEMLQKDAPIDFTKVLDGYYVGYHITAEDVRKTALKKLYMKRLMDVFVFDMSEWVTDPGNNQLTPKGLTNSNMAGVFLPLYGINVPMPVVKGSDGAAEITTSRTVSPTTPQTLIPGVTAGTLFLGQFALDIENTLKSTHFGVPAVKRPETFKFTYKYAPGSEYNKTVQRDSIYLGDEVTYNTTEIVPNGKDSCSINAYLYEVANYDEYLDGTNINTSDKVILKASFVAAAVSSYDTQEISFVKTGNKDYDASKKYKLAIVCSSSKRGDEFMGGDGSKLWVKYLEVK